MHVYDESRARTKATFHVDALAKHLNTMYEVCFKRWPDAVEADKDRLT